jgi:4-hydroxybenzoate polyprenyltransferase
MTAKIKFSCIWAYLQLMRPANILTAWADILLGFAAAGGITTEIDRLDWIALGWLILSTTGLYGGGVVFNDVCDAELDAIERRERPLPSGRASLPKAIALGSSLLVMGIVAAAMVSLASMYLAGFVAIAALIYDKFGKHQRFGPINMGLCRGGNLLLGVSVTPQVLSERWYIALIPIIYIVAITAISRGEVGGGKKSTGIIALLLIATAIAIILSLGLLPSYSLLITLPFLILFTALVVPAFVKAALTPSAELIQMAVKTGILSLIILDATIAAGFSNVIYGLSVLALLPLSRWLARLFAVT